MTAKLHTPGRIIAIDLADDRLGKALEFGADVAVNNGNEDALARVLELTGGLGVDVAIEAVGVPATFELCTQLIRPGCRVANVGVHGKCVSLHLEKLWIRDATITTGTVRRHPHYADAAQAGRRRPARPNRVRDYDFPLSETEKAYEVFGAAAETHALKVVLQAVPAEPGAASSLGGALAVGAGTVA